jgi:unsaturated rhamnogalacturonyl hydrolase
VRSVGFLSCRSTGCRPETIRANLDNARDPIGKGAVSVNLQLAQEKAHQVYEYMKRGNAGLKQETADAVDRNPASWGMDIDDWDWNAGVGLIAISDYCEKTNNPEVLQFLKSWVARNMHQCAKRDYVNFLAPLAIYPDMFERTDEPYYKDVAVEYADWVMTNAARSKDGVFYHGASVSGEVWADTVFMALIFLSCTARLTRNLAIGNQVTKQLLSHLQLLQDDRTGALYHGYHVVEDHHMSGALWARGNSWVVIGTPMIVEILHGLVQVPEEIKTRYKKLVNGILRFQADNGLWHTVMDRRDFYQETSGSAGYAAGIMKAVRLRLLDPGTMSNALKACEGVIGKINAEGAVEGVSGGTPIMPTIDAYGQLTRYPTLYGQGLTLLMLSEYILQEQDRLKGKQGA